MDVPAAFASTPCNRWFGFRLLACSRERVEVALPVRAEMLQEEGVVQGGILTALADAAAVWLLWPDRPAERGLTGTGVSMQFLAAATLDRGPLHSTAVPLRLGRTVAVIESTLHQADRLVAKGTFTFLWRERRGHRAPV